MDVDFMICTNDRFCCSTLQKILISSLSPLVDRMEWESFDCIAINANYSVLLKLFAIALIIKYVVDFTKPLIL